MLLKNSNENKELLVEFCEQQGILQIDFNVVAKISVSNNLNQEKYLRKFYESILESYLIISQWYKKQAKIHIAHEYAFVAAKLADAIIYKGYSYVTNFLLTILGFESFLTGTFANEVPYLFKHFLFWNRRVEVGTELNFNERLVNLPTSLQASVRNFWDLRHEAL